MRDSARPLALARRPASGQAIVIILILLAMAGGGAWWLYSSRDQSERDARAFAAEAATRLAFHYDDNFLKTRFDRHAQVKYPPSFRERFFTRLRALGTPSGTPEVTGAVRFTSQFFQPVGEFECRINYPHAPAIIAMAISRPSGWWQIDYLNLTYTPPPDPAAQPAAGTPAPTAAPSP